MSSPPRVLLISTDTIDRKMAGPGIRYWNLARVIASQQPVTLATPCVPPMDAPAGVSIVAYGDGSRDEQARALARLIGEFDVIVSQMPPYLYLEPQTLHDVHLVIDLYAPWFLEKLEYARIDPDRGEALRADDLEILNRLLAIGDFYLCASERQRDFWLGALAASGRLTTRQLDADPELRSLIDVVSLGLPEHRPLPNGPGPRELFAPICAGDPLILWHGGIWNWLDPITAIHATHLLVADGLPARLIFMGVRSPSLEVAEMELVDTARKLAADLGLLDTHVFFNDWVEYDKRQNWLLQAALTLSLHQPTIESRFAFRTRLLDNLWCRVPIVATEGDVLSDIVASEGLGRVVPPAQPRAVAQAMLDIIQSEKDGDLRRRIASVAHRYTWELVAEPLLGYCRQPWKNPPVGTSSDYIHKLERLYTETADYARSLEQVVTEKNEALEALPPVPEATDPWTRRWQVWKRRG